jgi:hypothetical protein
MPKPPIIVIPAFAGMTEKAGMTHFVEMIVNLRETGHS